jgi:hypothetical protein
MRSTNTSTCPPLGLRPKPRLDDARVVEHEGVALIHQRRQLGELALMQRTMRIDVQ